MTRISFIMPTFNRAHFIEESIAAITSQMGSEDELIVVDDGSSDGTGDLLQNSVHEFQYIYQENSGKSVALNRAMAGASGAYIWICDDDDLLYPGAVATLVDCIESNGADFVFGRYTRFRERDGQREEFGTGYWPDLSSGSLTRHILEDSFVMHNASLVRHSAYDRVGGFDEKMLRSLDYDMFVRLAMRCSCAYADAIIFGQRKHEGARGPAKVLHAAGKSDHVWKEFDRRIFERLRDDTDLDYFAGMFKANDPELIRRAAFLQRAAIMARHDLWAYALDDLEAAAAVSAKALSDIERDICVRVVTGKHGFAGALDPDIRSRLRTLSLGMGREIAQTVLSGLLWRFRAPEWAAMKDAAKLIFAVGGPSAFVSLLTDRVRNGGNARPTVLERATVPPLSLPDRG